LFWSPQYFSFSSLLNFCALSVFCFCFLGALLILVSLCNFYVSVVVGSSKCKPKLEVECLTIDFEHHFTTRVHTSLLAWFLTEFWWYARWRKNKQGKGSQ
jgi:hypothetical protein